MVKVLNVTVDDHIMDDIVENARPEGMNKSEWVRRLLSYGWQVEQARREQVVPVGSVKATSKAPGYKTNENGGTPGQYPDTIIPSLEIESNEEVLMLYRGDLYTTKAGAWMQ